jgi:predicted phage baseplate assembly protein
MRRVEPPIIDSRTFSDLLRLVMTRAREFAPEWYMRVQDDPGMVLAAIYAHYLEILLERLNRVPEKNFLAFLDFLGVSLLPPSPATAPVVFTLAPTAGTSGIVPKGTQVATMQTETQPAVVFETEQDLNVVAAQFVASYSVEPARDRYANHTARVTR